MTGEDYIFTTNGFRKVANPIPIQLRIPLPTMKKSESVNTALVKKPVKGVLTSDAMDKYKKTEVNSEKYRGSSAPPNVKYRASSTLPSRRTQATTNDVIYSVRNPDCAPPRLYLHENVRLYAKHNQPQRSPTPRRRVQSADVAYRFGKPIRLPAEWSDNEHLTNEGLTMGQKQYIWGIARCYSMENLKKLNQRHIRNTLEYEFTKRAVTKGLKENTKARLWKEYADYKHFIESTAKNGFVRTMHNPSPCSRTVGNHKVSREKYRGGYGQNDNSNNNNNDDNDNAEATPQESYDFVIVNSPESKSFHHNINRETKSSQTIFDDKEQKQMKLLQRPKSAFHAVRQQEDQSNTTEHQSLREEGQISRDLVSVTNIKLGLHDVKETNEQESDDHGGL